MCAISSLVKAAFFADIKNSPLDSRLFLRIQAVEIPKDEMSFNLPSLPNLFSQRDTIFLMDLGKGDSHTAEIFLEKGLR